MQNEFLFFFHTLLTVGFLFGAHRLGVGALQALVALQAVLANVFVLKQMSLFGFSVTCSDVYAIGAILGLNLIQESFGKEEAKKAVAISFFSLILFTAMSQIHLAYIPIPQDQSQASFAMLLSQTPRITIASIGVYYIVQRLDLVLFGWLKKIFFEKNLGIRMALSLGVTQLLDTVLFTFFGLYGLVTSLFDIIAVSFFVKCLIIGFSSPIVALSKRWVKRVSI